METTTPRRGVIKEVLGTLFPGIWITDFWGAYNAIEALAKQRCYYHLFTEPSQSRQAQPLHGVEALP
ncbi:MAG: hypothetical protein ACREXS_05565 [Gammaproteobacteria bacterium]